MATTESRNCFMQRSRDEQILAIYDMLIAPKTTVVGQVAASGSFTIPVGATAWSVFVTGANATIGGTAVVTLTALSGNGPLAAGLALVAGATTTIGYSYQILA